MARTTIWSHSLNPASASHLPDCRPGDGRTRKGARRNGHLTQARATAPSGDGLLSIEEDVVSGAGEPAG
jgi:hypothetical protein